MPAICSTSGSTDDQSKTWDGRVLNSKALVATDCVKDTASPGQRGDGFAVPEQLGVEVTAPVLFWFLDFDGDAIGVGPGILSDPGDLPGHLLVGVSAGNRELSVRDSRRNVKVGSGPVQRGERVAVVPIERLEPLGNSTFARPWESMTTVPLYTFIMSGDSTNEWRRYLLPGSRGWSILNEPPPLDSDPVTAALPLAYRAVPPFASSQ